MIGIKGAVLWIFKPALIYILGKAKDQLSNASQIAIGKGNELISNFSKLATIKGNELIESIEQTLYPNPPASLKQGLLALDTSNEESKPHEAIEGLPLALYGPSDNSSGKLMNRDIIPNQRTKNFIETIIYSLNEQNKNAYVYEKYVTTPEDIEYMRCFSLGIERVLIAFLNNILERSEIELWIGNSAVSKIVKNALVDYLYPELYLKVANKVIADSLEKARTEKARCQYINQIKIFFKSDLKVLDVINKAKYQAAYSRELLNAIKNKDIFSGDIIKICALGADPNANLKEDSWNWTALHWVTYYGRYELIAPLVRLGANLKAKDYYGQTPLMVSVRYLRCKNADTRVIKALLEQAQRSFSE